MGSQLAEKRQFGHLALDGARALARSTLPEPLEARLSALSKGSTKVYVLSCAQPLTSEAKENLRSIVLKGPFDKPSFEFFQVP